MDHSPYLNTALVNMTATVDKAAQLLKGMDFDAIVVTGISGMLIGPAVAYKLKKRLAVIRKPDDKDNHASCKIESCMKQGDRWIFFDDMIATGTTARRVETLMGYQGWPPMVGSYMYNYGEYTPGRWT